MIYKRETTLPVVYIRATGMRSKILTCQPQTVTLIVPFWLVDARLVSVTVCGWHVRILLRIPVARILWDFDFLWGLAPGRLDGFSIGRYEKKGESSDLYAAKFESGAMRFWEKNRPGAGTLSKQGFLPCLSIIKNSQRRSQIHSKSLKKPLLRQKDDYTPQVR